MPTRILDAADAEITLASAVASLPFPPVSCGLVPSNWTLTLRGVAPEFDLDIWSTGALSLTSAELFGGKQRAYLPATAAMTTWTAATDTVTKVAHGYLTGDGPFQLTNAGGAVPAGLALLTDYYVVKVDADNFKLATTFANAMARTPVVVDFTTAGTGTTSMVASALTMRVYWASYGALQPTITLDINRAFAVRCSHRPGCVAYAVTGTLSTGTVSAGVTPIVEG